MFQTKTKISSIKVYTSFDKEIVKDEFSSNIKVSQSNKNTLFDEFLRDSNHFGAKV